MPEAGEHFEVLPSDCASIATRSLNLRNVTTAEQKLLAEVDPSRLPVHIAVIMDGNRRWAKERSLPLFMGHRAGLRVLRHLWRACSDIGVRVLTVYAFSVDNWKRSQQEVAIIMPVSATSSTARAN